MKLDSAVFYSADIGRVTEFYTKVIGLEFEYRQEDKYVSFKFENGVRLGIKKSSEDREVPGTQTIFIGVDNAEAEFKRLSNLNVEFAKELTIKDYGTEFSVLDPDKNKVLFIQRN